MSIPESFSFDKSGEVVRYPRLRPYFLTITIVLLAVLSFGIGRLTSAGRGGVVIEYPNEPMSGEIGQVATSGAAPKTALQSPSSQVYASSQGKRYYYLQCKSSISEKNKITFANSAMAEAAGYTLASNCTQP